MTWHKLPTHTSQVHAHTDIRELWTGDKLTTFKRANHKGARDNKWSMINTACFRGASTQYQHLTQVHGKTHKCVSHIKCEFFLWWSRSLRMIRWTLKDMWHSSPSSSIFKLLFNTEATMTGDKVAISLRATHHQQQKMNYPRSILHSLIESLSSSLRLHKAH